MTYTADELRKGRNAVTDKAWTIDLGPSGPYAQINHEGLARAVLDAVLPDHDRRIQAKTLQDAADMFRVANAELRYARFAEYLDLRIASLAGPVETP